MTDDFPDPHELQERAARRRQRREEQRRRLRRQRRLAGAGALVVAAAVLAAALSSLGGSSGPGAAEASSRGADWKPHTGPVPILEYHVLGRPKTEVAYPELYVARAAFRKEMDWLDRQGYEVVTLDEVEAAWYRGGTLPARPVV